MCLLLFRDIKHAAEYCRSSPSTEISVQYLEGKNRGSDLVDSVKSLTIADVFTPLVAPVNQIDF